MTLRLFSPALLLTIAATPALGQHIRKTNPPGVARPVGSYSHVTEVPPGTRMLFLAGQVGNRLDGSLPASIEAQAAQAFDDVRAILASQGARPDHIVKMTIYAAAKPTDPAAIGRKHAEMFKGTEPPPNTWVYVSQLARPEYLIEIEVVAAVPTPAG
jgi:enamine deaminase RidA (YjgF/YER057c/UK114 family)